MNSGTAQKRSGPYHVAKNGKDKEAWAYNETRSTVGLYVRDIAKQQIIRISVRKSVLRNLAGLFVLSLLALSCGCAIRKPILAVYCDQKSADGKHCQKWAQHDPGLCVKNQWGDCAAGSQQ